MTGKAATMPGFVRFPVAIAGLARRFRAVALLSAAPLLLAMQAVPYYGPNGNGTLEHEDDLRWLAFHDASVVADEKKGVYIARFSPALKNMDGKMLQITGYMLPVEPTTHSAHFILTRRSTGCPFCPPNEPTEAIEVRTTAAVDYTQAPVTLRGRLHLVARSDMGLFYRVDEAKKL